jgi:hypothetical protein
MAMAFLLAVQRRRINPRALTSVMHVRLDRIARIG